MSQAAAIFLSSILPSAAGTATAAANTTAQGETFAATLVQLQATLSLPQNANATPTVRSSPDAATLTIFGIAPKPAANVSEPMGAPGLLDSAALLPQTETSLLDPSETPTPAAADAPTAFVVTAQTPELPIETPVVAQAASQSNATTKTAQTSNTSAPAVAKTAQTSNTSAPAVTKTAQTSNTSAPAAAQIALRGSFTEQALVAVPAVETQPSAKTAETTTPVTTSPQAPTLANTKPPAAPKRATPDQPAKNQSQQSDAPQTTKQADPAQPAVSQSQAAPATGNATAPQPQTPPAETPAAPQPIAAATAQPLLPSLIEVQQLTTAAAAPQAGVPVDALAIHIARKLEAGLNQFEIRLHPAELGQLDISLTVADDGQVHAMLRVERPETLEMLQRDARSLEQQLRQAGLEVGSNALSFSLSSGNGQRHAPFTGWPGFADAQGAATPKDDTQAAAKYLAVRMRDGVDIRV